MSEHPAHAGFTLIEALFGIAVLAVLTALAIPSVQGLSAQSRAAAAAEQLAGDLALARTEAVKRNRAATVEITGTSTYTVEFVGNRSLDGADFREAPDSVRFASFGPPLTGSARFVVGTAGFQKTVVVDGAGFVSVQ